MTVVAALGAQFAIAQTVYNCILQHRPPLFVAATHTLNAVMSMLGIDAAVGHDMLVATIIRALKRADVAIAPLNPTQLWDAMLTSGFAAQMAASLRIMGEFSSGSLTFVTELRLARQGELPGLWIEHRWCMLHDVPGDATVVYFLAWAGVYDDECLRQNPPSKWWCGADRSSRPTSTGRPDKGPTRPTRCRGPP
jgi:hypothetical protein